MSNPFDKSAFEEAVGHTFTLPFDNGETLNLELDSVKANPNLNNEKQECFSAYFSGPAEKGLIQGSYVMDHEKMGRLHIFLVPVAKDEKGFQYEAVFNRLIEEES